MNDAMFSSKTCEWETPQDFFDKLNKEFHFTLDPCATPDNAKCEKYFTKEQDGLKQDWTGETVYCNPPYGREMPLWIEKCARHAAGGGHCCDADSGKDRYTGVPQVHIRKSGNQIHQGPLEVWSQQKQRPVSVDGRCVQRDAVTPAFS